MYINTFPIFYIVFTTNNRIFTSTKLPLPRLHNFQLPRSIARALRALLQYKSLERNIPLNFHFSEISQRLQSTVTWRLAREGELARKIGGARAKKETSLFRAPPRSPALRATSVKKETRRVEREREREGEKAAERKNEERGRESQKINRELADRIFRDARRTFTYARAIFLYVSVRVRASVYFCRQARARLENKKEAPRQKFAFERRYRYIYIYIYILYKGERKERASSERLGDAERIFAFV